MHIRMHVGSIVMIIIVVPGLAYSEPDSNNKSSDSNSKILILIKGVSLLRAQSLSPDTATNIYYLA